MLPRIYQMASHHILVSVSCGLWHELTDSEYRCSSVAEERHSTSKLPGEPYIIVSFFTFFKIISVFVLLQTSIRVHDVQMLQMSVAECNYVKITVRAECLYVWSCCIRAQWLSVWSKCTAAFFECLTETCSSQVYTSTTSLSQDSTTDCQQLFT